MRNINSTRYHCPDCPETFRTIYAFNEHLKKKHDKAIQKMHHTPNIKSHYTLVTDEELNKMMLDSPVITELKDMLVVTKE